MALGRGFATFLRSQTRVRLANGSSLSRPRISCLALRLAPVLACRSYATPGRPKKAVGETSRPVKRRTTKTTTTEAATKPKAKPKAKPKKKAAKPKPKKKARKPQSEKAKVRAEATRKNAETKRLKTVALLDAPSVGTINSFAMFLKDHPARALKESRSAYTALSDAEKQTFTAQGHELQKSRIAEYSHWVQQHTPEEIRLANLARKQLRTRLKSISFPELKDDRSVKRPLGPYITFAAEHQDSLPGLSVAERGKELGARWRALDSSEKQKYFNHATQDKARYVQEYQSVYGHPPHSSVKSSSSSSPSASP